MEVSILENKLPLVLDSTVLLNFIKINKIDILVKLYGGSMVIPQQVKLEVIIDSNVGPVIENLIKDKIIEEYIIDYKSTGREIKDYCYLSKRFGQGESACIAIAKNWKGTVVSDDMTATCCYCTRNRISLKGSLGIIYEAYEKKIISLEEGQAILDDMISISKYKSPVNKFDDIINWFEKKIGRELF